MGLLTSPRFAGDERLERAANNRPPLMKPEISDGVKKLQQALVDQGYEMPISFAKGGPDGIYGDETARVVRQFQMDQNFPPRGWDGRAGHDTLLALDKLFQPTPPPPPPPPPGPGPQPAVTVRKSVWKLTNEEQQRYVRVVKDMISDGVYGMFVNFHRDMSFNMHAMDGGMPRGRMRFLPWHRIFLRRFEVEMQRRDPACFVPFWDWINSSPRGYPEWLNAFISDPPLEVPCPAMSAIIPPTAVKITRDPTVVNGGKKKEIVNFANGGGALLEKKNFYEFTHALEDFPHNNIHDWFGSGSTMANINVSPSDPIFWTHHAEVDRQWTLWQFRPSHVGMNPDFSRRQLVPPEDYFNADGDEAMNPFPAPNREDQFRDMRSQYVYDTP